jgi:hypothetical protein
LHDRQIAFEFTFSFCRVACILVTSHAWVSSWHIQSDWMMRHTAICCQW